MSEASFTVTEPPPPAATAAVTNAVDAACVVFVPGNAVGTVGVPVSAGDASGAFAFTAAHRLFASVPARVASADTCVARLMDYTNAASNAVTKFAVVSPTDATSEYGAYRS